MQQEDKAQHVICAFMAVVMLSPSTSLLDAAVFIFTLGLLKEAWDYYLGTGFCWYDIAANGAGILFAGLCLFTTNQA
jgi:hypothetical protein